MSTWRKEALQQLPELRKTIIDPWTDTPMALWIGLKGAFDCALGQAPEDLDLARRICRYAVWCLNSPSDDVQNAAAVGFCEHLGESELRRRALPKLIGRRDFVGLRELIVHHSGQEIFEDALGRFGR